MAISSLPEFIRENYEVHEWKHAIAILEHDFPAEWQDIIDVLTAFRLRKSYIATGGGNKSDVAGVLDRPFFLKVGERKIFKRKWLLMGMQSTLLLIKWIALKTRLPLKSNGIIKTLFMIEI